MSSQTAAINYVFSQASFDNVLHINMLNSKAYHLCDGEIHSPRLNGLPGV